MQLKPGDKLGPYEIVSAIGKGGMGEVWKARDPRLNRDVAIKISAEQFTDRFEREAKVVASLNHANICTLHDVGPNYLVMELVEGPTLAERIAQGPVSLAEALAIAKQIADGLEAAHEKNVVHRDLKPANVKIKPDGSVKVLDFGLAKSGEVTELTPDSPTMLTVHGMILGTAGYMAPEQAAGQPVDKRADVWAFGVVLYEILTGQRLFQGDSVAHILADVLRGPIDLDKLPKETPRRIRNLMKRCLDRDLRTRLRDIREARVAIEAADEQSEGAATAPAGPRIGVAGWMAAALFALIAAALAFVHFRERPPDPQVLRYTIALPEKTAVDDFAISPDGRSVAIRGLSGKGNPQLWVRPLDSLEARALPGTEGASYPFWSPDSRYIGFFANGKLKKLAAVGGPPQTLCDAENGRGGAWSSEGVIVFSPANQSGLNRVSAAGGIPVPVIKAGSGSGLGYLRFPVFLPGGRWFLYSNIAGTSPGIYLGSLDSSTARRIAPDLSRPQYMPPAEGSRNGYLLIVREGTLMAQPVDARTLDAAGDLFPVAEHVADGNLGEALFSLSPGGILIYDAGGGTRPDMLGQLSWLDRAGKLLKSFGSPGIVDFALSPDEKKLALERRTSHGGFGSDLWVADLEHGTESRLTFGGTTRAYNPVWSSDGSRIAFVYADRSNIFLRTSNGTGQEQVLFESGERRTPWDWSRDGKFLIFSLTARGGSMDALPLADEGKPGDRKPIPLVRGEFTFRHGQVSPDGRWLAYVSNESGRLEVYVQPFAPAPRKPPEGKWQISTGGGNQPRWRADAKELFYQALDTKIMTADVHATGTTFDHGTPQALFTPRMNPDMVTAGGFHYAVSADGKRFLIRDLLGTADAAQPLTVVVNWLAAVKK